MQRLSSKSFLAESYFLSKNIRRPNINNIAAIVAAAQMPELGLWITYKTRLNRRNENENKYTV